MSSRRRDRREPSADELLRLAERADLLDDPAVQRLVSAGAATENTALKRQVEKTLAAQATQQQAQPFDTDTLAVPDPTNQVTLGTALTGSHYTLQEDDLTQHLLAVGQSGAGKTTLFYNLIDQLTAPFWSFDVKQDYRHLIHDRDDLLVLPWKELKFNPLKPPQDVLPRRWAQVFAELFGHATALLSGSKNYLMQAIIQLYQLYDLFQEVAPPYPSLHELQLLAERENINYMRTSSDYRDRILNGRRPRWSMTCNN